MLHVSKPFSWWWTWDKDVNLFSKHPFLSVFHVQVSLLNTASPLIYYQKENLLSGTMKPYPFQVESPNQRTYLVWLCKFCLNWAGTNYFFLTIKNIKIPANMKHSKFGYWISTVNFPNFDQRIAFKIWTIFWPLLIIVNHQNNKFWSSSLFNLMKLWGLLGFWCLASHLKSHFYSPHHRISHCSPYWLQYGPWIPQGRVGGYW